MHSMMELRDGKEESHERFERQGSGRDRCVEGDRRGYRQGLECGRSRGGGELFFQQGGRGDRVVADIKANGGKAIAVKGDVAKVADVQRLFDETKKAFGTIDVLVNNAGVYKFVPLEDITEDEFHREFNINVLGTILATKEAVKHFGPNGGSVINMSSIASAGEAQAAIYSGTKGAVDAIIEHPRPRRRAFRVWRRAGMGILKYWCLTV